MRSVAQHSFAQIPQANIGRSSFDRSCTRKWTMDADYLYPIWWDIAIPGDTMRMNPQFFARMSTPINPIMDNLHFDYFFFECPIRLLQANWEKLLGAQDDPGDSIDYTMPVVTGVPTTGYSEESIYDYLGIPPGKADIDVLAYPLRAYNKIWNQWFRSQDLQDSVTENGGDGPDTATDYTLLKRGKRHDYFTACLPYPQKSDTAVSMPLGTSAPVTTTANDGESVQVVSTTLTANNPYNLDTDGTAGGHLVLDGGNGSGSRPLYADLSSATAATINAMRLAVVTQQFLERDARGGTRINEIIWSHYGVRSLDARLQIPEYLGGGSQMVGIQTIPQSSESNTTPQGNLAAMGTVMAGGGGFTKSFTEFSIVMCIVNVRADLTYQQGLHKFWSLSTRFDLPWPEFQNIGEESVLQKEIELASDAAGTNDNVFGYQERYAAWKYSPNMVLGKFRSSATGTLDPWHLSEELSSPALNSTFIQSNTPMSRVEAVSSEPDFICDAVFNLNHVRPLQLYSTPGLARF
jgi:hypothetical protein